MNDPVGISLAGITETGPAYLFVSYLGVSSVTVYDAQLYQALTMVGSNLTNAFSLVPDPSVGHLYVGHEAGASRYDCNAAPRRK